MPEQNGLAALAADLRGLAPRQRRAVLASLTPFERARVAVLIESSLEEQPDAFAALSPWLALRFRESAAGDPRAQSLTPATVALLASVATGFSSAALTRESEAPAPPRSLFGVVAGLFGTRRAGW